MKIISHKEYQLNLIIEIINEWFKNFTDSYYNILHKMKKINPKIKYFHTDGYNTNLIRLIIYLDDGSKLVLKLKEN